MLDDDAFWCSGGARGVDHIGGVARVERRARALWRAAARSAASRRPAARCAPGCAALPCAGTGSRSSSACCVTSTGGAGVRQHEGQPLARVVRVERQVGAAGLEDAEQPDHHLGRALHAEPHQGLGPDAEAAQVVGQPVGVRVELRVGQRAVLEHHRDRVRRAPRLRGKQRRQRAPARDDPAPCRSSPRRMVARSASPGSPAARAGASGVGHRRRQQPHQPLARAPRRVPRSNRSAAYSSTPVDAPPARRRAGAAR